MLYTSGTTGRPKGAVRQPLDPAAIVPLVQHIGFEEDDVYLTTGPLYHSGPGGFLQIAQLFGNTAVIQRRFDPEDWLRLVQVASTSSLRSVASQPTSAIWRSKPRRLTARRRSALPRPHHFCPPSPAAVNSRVKPPGGQFTCQTRCQFTC
jgi:acyl-coenzyme A synthetase/AMP-(fatty) acid ligase